MNCRHGYRDGRCPICDLWTGPKGNLVDRVDPARVDELEAEGMDNSTAMGVAMAEIMTIDQRLAKGLGK